jgi:DNA-binding transcriptional LysR family regulator
MTQRQVSWDYWKTFKAVLETGSLSAAARVLSISQPTAGRHISALEEAFDGQLFTRSQSGLIPTPLASSLAPGADQLETITQTLLRTAVSEPESLQGVVRITSSEIVGAEVLPPLLEQFRREYPSVRIELHLSNLRQDLLRRDADIAVRMVRPEQGKLVAREIGDYELGLYAHETYLARRGEPRSAMDLLQHDLIGLDRDFGRLSSFNLDGRPVQPSDFSLRCDSDLGQLACLRAGLGIGICQEQIAARMLALRRVLPDVFAASLPVWLVMHEDLKSDRCVRALYNHLAATL